MLLFLTCVGIGAAGQRQADHPSLRAFPFCWCERLKSFWTDLDCCCKWDYEVCWLEPSGQTSFSCKRHFFFHWILFIFLINEVSGNMMILKLFHFWTESTWQFVSHIVSSVPGLSAASALGPLHQITEAETLDLSFFIRELQWDSAFCGVILFHRNSNRLSTIGIFAASSTGPRKALILRQEP